MRYIWLLRGFLERRKRLIALLLVAFVGGLLFLSYFCPESLCSSVSSTPSRFTHLPSEQTDSYRTRSTVSLIQRNAAEVDLPRVDVGVSDEEVERTFSFDADRDVLVFLHAQKTGGSTFERHLVRDTAAGVPAPCMCRRRRKRCDCGDSRGRQWLFSRYSSGWVCGLHADWTELHDCVPRYLDKREGEKRQRRYLYFTILRDPVQRYISEWKHVQRGSTWISAKLMCNGRQATLQEVPFCFKGSDWTGVTLEEFMSCRHNLANNRQTRMLANLTLVGCYDHSAIPDSAERDRILLDSAVGNLRQLAFFGLTERQADTQFLFERTFGIRFRRRFVQFNNTHAHKVDFTDDERAAVQRLNRLDLALYKFASRLFDERVRWARAVDKSDDGASWHVAGFDTVHEDNDSILDSDSYNGDDEPDEEDENEQ